MNEYVLRYPDGMYNRGDGWPVDLAEATVYPSFEAAQAVSMDVDPCEIIDVAQANQEDEKEAALQALKEAESRELEIMEDLGEALSLLCEIHRELYSCQVIKKYPDETRALSELTQRVYEFLTNSSTNDGKKDGD